MKTIKLLCLLILPMFLFTSCHVDVVAGDDVIVEPVSLEEVLRSHELWYVNIHGAVLIHFVGLTLWGHKPQYKFDAYVSWQGGGVGVFWYNKWCGLREPEGHVPHSRFKTCVCEQCCRVVFV